VIEPASRVPANAASPRRLGFASGQTLQRPAGSFPLIWHA